MIWKYTYMLNLTGQSYKYLAGHIEQAVNKFKQTALKNDAEQTYQYNSLNHTC